ncbi:SRPBCC domain-containing protein [Nocardia altamirensis]|uniref:SRPBCC domain-containing protein n=1 Tax=Nocardia altamirensis TaxID=472158 RepID=UPI0008405A65|nr:SRPBCC domain-containing protein [Nocardia altamirensis]
MYEDGFGPQQVTTPETFAVVCTREFAAPVAEVWRAWEDPTYVTQWWGPTGFTSPSADMDFRVGGTSVIYLRGPAEFRGRDIYNTLTYRLIEPTSLIEFDLALTNAASAATPRTRPRRHIVTFTAVASKWTAMTVTEFGYPTELVRDHAKAELEQCLDKLTTLLEKN